MKKKSDSARRGFLTKIVVGVGAFVSGVLITFVIALVIAGGGRVGRSIATYVARLGALPADAKISSFVGWAMITRPPSSTVGPDLRDFT